MLYDPNKNHLVLTFIVFPLDDPLLTFRKLLIHSQNSKPFSLSLFEIIAMNYIFQLALWNIYAIPKLQTPGAENIHFPAVDVRFHTAHNFYFLTKSAFIWICLTSNYWWKILVISEPQILGDHMLIAWFTHH